MTDTTTPTYVDTAEHGASEAYSVPRTLAETEPEAPRLIAGRGRTQPVRVLQHRDESAATRWVESADRVPVFVVEQDGKQRVFDMPAAPNPGMLLRFLRDLRTNPSAIVELIERACGTDAVDALIDELEGMDPDEANATMQGVSQRIQQNIGGGIKR